MRRVLSLCGRSFRNVAYFPIAVIFFFGKVLANYGFLCTKLVGALPALPRKIIDATRFTCHMVPVSSAKLLRFFTAAFLIAPLKFCTKAARFCLRGCAIAVAAALTPIRIAKGRCGGIFRVFSKIKTNSVKSKKGTGIPTAAEGLPAKESSTAVHQMPFGNVKKPGRNSKFARAAVKIFRWSILLPKNVLLGIASFFRFLVTRAATAVFTAVFFSAKLVWSAALATRSGIIFAARLIKYGGLVARFELGEFFHAAFSTIPGTPRRALAGNAVAKPAKKVAWPLPKTMLRCVKFAATAVVSVGKFFLKAIFAVPKWAFSRSWTAVLSVFGSAKLGLTAIILGMGLILRLVLRIFGATFFLPKIAALFAFKGVWRGILAVKWLIGMVARGALVVAMSPIVLLGKLWKAVRAAGRRVGTFFNLAATAAKREVTSVVGRVATVVRAPATVLSFVFALVAFFGLRSYDKQISGVEYNRASITANRAKKMLHQKTRFARIPSYDGQTSRRQSIKNIAIENPEPVKTFPKGDSELRKVVDEFFCNHKVSEVMCEKGFCKIKIDDKVVDEHSVLGENDDIYIFETDGDNIVFADASGNKCVKSIDSLFN